MSDQSHVTGGVPPAVDSVLRRFRVLGREEKMQALVSYARRLEPVPEPYRALTDEAFIVPECQTPVRIFPERRDGTLHFYAEVDVRRSPTVAAFLSIVFEAINDRPPDVTLAIPDDFVRVVMQSIGLGAREVGLEALVARLKRDARHVRPESPIAEPVRLAASSQAREARTGRRPPRR